MRRVLVRVAVVALLALSALAEHLLAAARPVKAPALQESAFAALGGLRSIAAEVIWFRADRLQEEGRYVELSQLAGTLTLMEPHTPEVWSYAAWNLSYNVSIMMATHEDRWRWVTAALKLLRDDGLRLNPTSAELYRELAWMFQLKIGANLDAASYLYRRKWRAIVEDVAARNAWDELRMDPTRMDEVARNTGIADRADPQFSAIYWASAGLPYAKGNDRAFLEEIIRQAIVIHAHGGPRSPKNG